MYFNRGKITGIMGPSGIGKTTLLKLITGQISPTHGRVLVNNMNIHQLSDSKLYQLRKKMSMLFQSGALFDEFSVFDNIAFPLREHTTLKEEIIRIVVALKLEAVGLCGTEKLMPHELSGGMKRRVALARSIALEPELILYDEPFTGQDPIVKNTLVTLIKKLSLLVDLTSIVVSHDVPEILSIADFIYVIVGGAVIASGTKEELLNNPDLVLQQFLQGSTEGVFNFRYSDDRLMNQLLKVKQ